MEAKEITVEMKPLGPPLDPYKQILKKWRMGGPLDKQGILILILSGLVLLIGILLGIMVITSDLFAGLEESPAAIRNGTGQRLVVFSGALNRTSAQQVKTKLILKDERRV